MTRFQRWAIAVTGCAAVALGVTAFSSMTAASGNAPSILRYGGVNLASGAIGGAESRYGFTYIYPGAKDAAPYRAMGLNAVRLPVRWERLQAEPGGPLDETEMRRVDAMISAMQAFPLIILDIHNYGSHQRRIIGSDGVPVDALADLWRRLAARYRDNSRVAFGLMNEPLKIPNASWRQAVDLTVEAIRKTGARNLILVPGLNWTGAHSWTKGGEKSNAALFEDFRDPGNNMAFEMHQYLDKFSSGNTADCVATEQARTRLTAATDWLRQHHARAFLAEFGSSNSPECLASLDALLSSIDDAGDVWLGWTYWAGGPWMNRYPFYLAGEPDHPGGQAAVLLRHLPKTSKAAAQ